MVNHLLLSFCNHELGVGNSTSKENYSYYCPFCHHHKRKLEVKLSEDNEGKNNWHCWACNKRGTTLMSLFKAMKIPQARINDLKKLVKTTKTYTPKEDKEQQIQVELPTEYVSLKNPDAYDIEAKHALNYLKKRGIGKYDILKYNIGFCEKGKYSGRIIIPIYDKDFNLIYFISRSYKPNQENYINPPASKDIIANEHLINWSLPLIICEGVFDAISIRRNAIPLLGKTISKPLMKKLLLNSVDNIYIVLDKDAFKTTLEFCELLIKENKKVYFVEMADKDPSKLGFSNFTKLIQTTQQLTYFDLLKMKLGL